VALYGCVATRVQSWLRCTGPEFAHRVGRPTDAFGSPRVSFRGAIRLPADPVIQKQTLRDLRSTTI
jgi:hypothetical protein